MSETFTIADMLSTIALGMGIVFIVLIILYLVMVVQHKVFNRLENRHQPVSDTLSIAQESAKSSEDTVSDEEAAAILAAISVYMRRDPSALRLVSLERQ